MEILNPVPVDQGLYTVRVTNPVGKDETSAKLTIRPATSTGQQPNQLGPLEVKAPPPTKEDMQQMQPPKVIVPIENAEVTEGSPILLKATIVGKPTPTVRLHNLVEKSSYLICCLVYLVQRWGTIEAFKSSSYSIQS